MTGWIQWPDESGAYTQGGKCMWVYLVVTEMTKQSWTDLWYGTTCHLNYDEGFVSDDVMPTVSAWSNSETYEAWHERLWRAERRHFPDLIHPEIAPTYTPEAHTFMGHTLTDFQYLSHPYLAALLLGVIDHTWYDMATGTYWHCTREHLTDQGQALYDMLAQLYAGQTLALLTFRD